ncbi:hypothetical protein DFH06DRAFT_1318587 [Mycena polygramma]|nr:hypothetical protein DFH06DRAFT_1318587 [Mycena polygramma]
MCLRQANFSLLTNFLIPTNEPRGIHWLLIEIDYRQTSISIYDSLPSEAFSSALEIAKSKYSLPLALAVLATQLIFKASQKVLPPVSQDWRLQTVPIPIQDNGIDCGFYMIMVALHLMHWGQVHHPDCPPILRISPTTMQQTRAILAATLIAWCTSDAPKVSQEPESFIREGDSEVHNNLAAIPKDKSGLVKAALPEAAAIGQEPSEELPQISYSPVPSSVDGEADMDSGAEAEMASEEMHVSCCTQLPSSVDGEAEMDLDSGAEAEMAMDGEADLEMDCPAEVGMPTDGEGAQLAMGNGVEAEAEAVTGDEMDVVAEAEALNVGGEILAGELDHWNTPFWDSSLTTLTPTPPPPPPPRRRGPDRRARP